MHDAREHYHRTFFLPVFALFTRWDYTGCLKNGVRLGQGKKSNSLIRKEKISDTPPPPHLHWPLRVWPLFRFLNPPPPPVSGLTPYSGFTLIPGSTLPGDSHDRADRRLLPGCYGNLIMNVDQKKKNVANRGHNVPVGSILTDTFGPHSRSRLSARYVLFVPK